MTARILVVDDNPINAKLLDARLTAEYFAVTTAFNGADALTICGREACDLVLLDVMMPGMDGFETCRRLKANPATAHVPVVMVTALDQPSDRVQGLEAGADDFLTKPIDETSLLARVKSLTRLKITLDELRNRSGVSSTMGGPEGGPSIAIDDGYGGHILLVEDRAGSSDRAASALGPFHRLDVEPDPQKALFHAADGGYDLVIVSLGLTDFDALRLCGQLRSLERTRHLPILLVADIEDRSRVLRGFDIGVNDYLLRPIDPNELGARARTQVRRKRYSDRLRMLLQSSIELALVDSLTGLSNRRYLDNHLAPLMQAAAGQGGSLCAMLLDLDHFKAVNDTHGHDVGDEVLRIFAGRVRNTVRSGDILCRLGGEEFIVILPATSLAAAETIAERIRAAVGQSPFEIASGLRSISVTVSIGIADRGEDVDPSALLKRADVALYRAKHSGRNKVAALAA